MFHICCIKIIHLRHSENDRLMCRIAFDIGIYIQRGSLSLSVQSGSYHVTDVLGVTEAQC